MGKIKGVVLNRKQYSLIRKMDHCQMTLWAEALYKSGYEDGRQSAEGLDISEIREVLYQVNGIGKKRADDIISALERELEHKLPSQKVS